MCSSIGFRFHQPNARTFRRRLLLNGKLWRDRVPGDDGMGAPASLWVRRFYSASISTSSTGGKVVLHVPSSDEPLHAPPSMWIAGIMLTSINDSLEHEVAMAKLRRQNTDERRAAALGAKNRTMIERLGLLFSDGSILILPEDTDLKAAEEEAMEHDWGQSHPFTTVIRVELNLLEIIRPYKSLASN